jgi:hypothetical protein
LQLFAFLQKKLEGSQHVKFIPEGSRWVNRQAHHPEIKVKILLRADAIKKIKLGRSAFIIFLSHMRKLVDTVDPTIPS